MPFNYLRQLTGAQRQQRANQHLGYSLAFIAGAMNAGGFLIVRQYTSHMTGIVSSMADALAVADYAFAIQAIAAILAFVSGAATTAVLVNWARERHLHSQYALSLLLEAGLLLLFGLAGAYLADMRELIAPATVLLLCFTMGLQNAIITKISGAEIRTTHVTGLTTDIGIEIGKFLFFRNHTPHLGEAHANLAKLRLHSLLWASFFLGGVIGAICFKHVGFSMAVPLAVWLAILAAVPVWDDLRHHILP